MCVGFVSSCSVLVLVCHFVSAIPFWDFFFFFGQWQSLVLFIMMMSYAYSFSADQEDGHDY